MKVKTLFKYWPLLLIFIIGFIWRTINFKATFIFNHDQDLYSWIAKDIVVNHHQRLVGQLTSVDGVFIGGFYYYLMAFTYWIFRMNPLSAVVPITIIGMFNIWSFFYVAGKHFGKRAGYWAAFLYAASFGAALFDRWSVPTEPTITWCIWFLDVIFEFYKGNWKTAPLYGLLVGFTWQVHIALLPVTILPILAYFIGDNLVKRWRRINLKGVLVGLFLFLISSSPFWIFEIKHNFSQVKAMAAGSQVNTGGITGLVKFEKVINASGIEMIERLVNGASHSWAGGVWLFWVGLCVVLVRSKKVKRSEIILLNGWIFLIMLAQFWSKRVVSEYYFTNLVPIVILMISVFLASYANKVMSIVIIGGYLYLNWSSIQRQRVVDESYLYKSKLVEWVKNDASQKQFPCVAINYISNFGSGVGFRYLFWYNGVELVKPGSAGAPTYNLFIPKEIMKTEENGAIFGRFGVALGPLPNKIMSAAECQKEENQLDPLLGYTE